MRSPVYSDYSRRFVSTENNAEQPFVKTVDDKKDRYEKQNRKKIEREKARKAFPMLTYNHVLYHPFSLDSLMNFIKRRPEDVSVSTIIELFVQKTTSPQYLHLIRKRVPRKYLNGCVAEDILDVEVNFAKFLLAEQYKDKHGISMEEEKYKKAKKVIRKRRKRTDLKDNVIVKDKKIVRRKKRENRTSSTPEYRSAYKDKIISTSPFSELKKLKLS